MWPLLLLLRIANWSFGLYYWIWKSAISLFRSFLNNWNKGSYFWRGSSFWKCLYEKKGSIVTALQGHHQFTSYSDRSVNFKLDCSAVLLRKKMMVPVLLCENVHLNWKVECKEIECNYTNNKKKEHLNCVYCSNLSYVIDHNTQEVACIATHNAYISLALQICSYISNWNCSTVVIAIATWFMTLKLCE